MPKLDALVFSDYEQIELRLLAYYMATLGDTSMADVIRAGLDLHTESTVAVFQLNRPPTEEERNAGKTFNFSIVYGGGTPTLMRQLGIEYLEARDMLRKFHARWPGIRVLQEAIQERIQERGYITTLFGRHLHPESEHKALNALVQGCAADLMKAALVKIHRGIESEGFESHMVSVIHDEVILDCVDAEVPRLAELLPTWMDDGRISEIVPIGVDIEISHTSWAEKERYEPGTVGNNRCAA